MTPTTASTTHDGLILGGFSSSPLCLGLLGSLASASSHIVSVLITFKCTSRS